MLIQTSKILATIPYLIVSAKFMMVFSILSFKLFINFRFFEENLKEPDALVQTNTEKNVSSLDWFSI